MGYSAVIDFWSPEDVSSTVDEGIRRCLISGVFGGLEKSSEYGLNSPQTSPQIFWVSVFLFM